MTRKIVKISIVLALSVIMLSACNESKAVSEIAVSSIEFLNDNSIQLETKDGIVNHNKSEVGFARSQPGETEFRLLEQNIDNPIKILEIPTYILFIPKDQIENVSKNYAKTYNETLTFTDPQDITELEG